MFTNLPEVVSYNEVYQKLNSQKITQTKKMKFNWLINRNQYSLYELWANWLLLIFPLVIILLLAIWFPIQEAHLNLLKTDWLTRFNLIKTEITMNRTEIISKINDIIANSGLTNLPSTVNGDAIYGELLKKLNSINVFNEIPTILSFTFLIEDVFFSMDTAGVISPKIVEAFLMNNGYSVLQSELLEFHTAFDFLSFDLSMDKIFKFYPATAVIILFSIALSAVMLLKWGQRKKRLKKPWKYKTLSEDLQVFKRQHTRRKVFK